MVDNNLWKNWHGCQCVKKILTQNGYESEHGLQLLDESNLERLENFIGNDWQSILGSVTKCDHFKIYTKQQKFKFLEGHKRLLLNWCKELNEKKLDGKSQLAEQSFVENPAFSPIMKVMITAALNNFQKPANTRRFPDLLKDFATYIYIMAGKATYEILAANIHLPKAKTICTFVFHLL